MASTAVTLFNSPNAAMPPELAAAFSDVPENVVPRDTTPALTFRGKTWRLRQGGEEIVLYRQNADGEKEPAPTVKVVVLNMNPKRSRTFYAGPYEEGKNQSPACWSSDGEKPDKEVRQPCAATCASCANSVKGSKITDNGKEVAACTPVKRLAVLPASMLEGMEPLLLKVPQTSMWDKDNPHASTGYFAWDQYVDFLRQRGVKHTAAVVTKIKFDTDTAYPKLLFTADRWLEAPEVQKIVSKINSPEVQKLLAGRINEGGEEAEAAPAPAVVTPTPPAQTVQQAPAQRPAPAAAPVPADDDDSFVLTQPTAFPPVQAAPASTGPAKPRAAKTASTVAAAPPPAPKPPVVPPAATASNDELAKLAAAWDD